MFGKSWKIRFDETLKYIGTKDIGLQNHLKMTVPQGSIEAISKELSLGWRSDGEDDVGFESNSNKRHALRALLLCQRVYFSNLWAGETSGLFPYTHSLRDFNFGNWKKDSLTFWKTKSEQEILGGLGMFYPLPAAGAPAVAAAAKGFEPNGAIPDYRLSRTAPSCPGDKTTCYNAVCAWLLKSGVVSYRWYMKDASPTQKDALTKMFGEGEEIWSPDVPFTDQSIFPDVPAGFIVHMYDERTGINGWNGHWIVSEGKGVGYGCNNGAVESDPYLGGAKVNREHSRLSLKGQFLQYSAEMKKLIAEVGENPKWVSFNPKMYQRGRAVQFDPMVLKGRL